MPSRIAIGIAPAQLRAPYDVQVIRESGETLPTYGLKNRFYVQGNANERYVIRVTNPTPNRVEAVVSVDGLDVIDGEAGDLRKRGYVVPPYGDVRIEGFRTSQADVATFRFSAVSESYAAKKGKARNVGVIAVAIFEEQAPEPEQQIIVGGNTYGGRDGYRRPYDYTDDLGSDEAESVTTTGSSSRGRGVAAKADRSAPKKSFDVGRAENSRMPAQSPSPTSVAPSDDSAGAPSRGYFGPTYDAPAPPPVAQRTNRPGLGTEFGESRYSAASYTRFVRGAGRPVAIAELRYNNAAGLIALGIHAEELPDANEIMTRETADPFPGDGRFALPPR
ncbi:MAG: hypothetical protein M3619_02760 [Myxococcota bacterium]|nr:hypothetical protein [Myxococcota bacterium]